MHEPQRRVAILYVVCDDSEGNDVVYLVEFPGTRREFFVQTRVTLDPILNFSFYVLVGKFYFNTLPNSSNKRIANPWLAFDLFDKFTVNIRLGVLQRKIFELHLQPPHAESMR